MSLNDFIKIGSRIKKIRNEKGISQKEMAEDILKIPRSTYSNYENNNRVPDSKTLQKIADFFETSIDFLIGIEEKNHTTVKIPILDRITNPENLYKHIIDEKEVPASKVSDGEYFYIKVKDDSMKGLNINKNNLLLIRKQKEIDNGNAALVLVDDQDEAIIRTVFKLEAENKNIKINKYHLQPQNHDYQIIIKNINKITIIGKCIKGEYKI